MGSSRWPLVADSGWSPSIAGGIAGIVIGAALLALVLAISMISMWVQSAVDSEGRLRSRWPLAQGGRAQGQGWPRRLRLRLSCLRSRS